MTGDKCPHCGQPMPGAALHDDCVCGHAKGEHHITAGRNLTHCLRVLCNCTQYRPLGVPGG